MALDIGKLDKIAAFIQTKYLDDGRFPFADLLIAQGDQAPWRWTSGVPQDAIFRIASMTKPVTSIAFMQLVEQGKASIDDLVSTYIPELADLGVFVSGGDDTPFVTRPPARAMRIIDLLRHTSGLTYSFQNRTPVDAAYRESDLENWIEVGGDDAFIDRLARIPLDFDPGTAWNYSVSTDVLGVIVARISGISLEEYFRAHIFEPIGMMDSYFRVPPEKADRIPACFAYHPEQKMRSSDAPGHRSLWNGKARFLSGGGGLASSMADYDRFARMLQNDGSIEGAQIIRRETLAQMTANHLPGGGDLTRHSKSMFSEAENAGHGFGLGFGTVIDPAAAQLPQSMGSFYWGGMYSTTFWVDPVHRLRMIFMTQLLPSSTYPVRQEIREMLYAALI